MLFILSLTPIHDGVVGLAESVGQAQLRSLDAIHIATAILLGMLFAYDGRLLFGAAAAGLPTTAPS
ncbi:MAG: hypothetical protein ACR2LV_05405 [Solirubrobacteraceae bacterium]